MTWIAAAIIGGSVVSGVIGASGAKDAAKTQADAANQASATQLAMFNQTQRSWMGFIVQKILNHRVFCLWDLVLLF